jgi:Zn-dependent protease with chaperone function
MDFFEQQARAHRKTKLLVVYFILAVICMIVMIYAAIDFSGMVIASKHRSYYDSEPFQIWHPQLFLAVTIGTVAVIFFGSLYKTMALAEGGSAVAESLGGRLIASDTSEPDERKLLNVVEEMSIASGVPMPKVYVLDEEDRINAFAAGHTPSDAAVAVTRNCMTKLSRDELQGVIGHEFSHILNGDMRLNIRLIGILFGIFCIATIGRILLQARSSNSRDRNPMPLLGLILLVIGSVGVFFGRLIQAAVSRQREFLADASSVQFTRNPGGLSGALQKIGGYGSFMESPHAPDACHLFFATGLSNEFVGLMATHPPLEARIKAIDPTWDGKFRRDDEDTAENLHLYRQTVPSRTSAPPLPNIVGAVLGGAVLASGTGAPPVIHSRSVLPGLGNPTPLHLKYAQELREGLPDDLKAAAREPLGASALIFSLLLSTDDSLRSTQLAELAGRTAPQVADRAAALFPSVSTVGPRARLPLINLALPALRQMTAAQYQQFSDALQWLINSDGKVELFEFVLQKVLLRHLDPQFNGPRKQVTQFYTLKPLVPHCAVVLSALANVGSEDAGQVLNAFNAGAPFMRAPEGSGLVLLPMDQCGIEQIDDALNILALAAPVVKKNLLEAAVQIVGADGIIQESEAELLRAIADTLDCPMPPLGVSE